MKFWDKLRGRRAARREEHEREAEEEREALERGEFETLGSHKHKIRDEYTEEGFPSAGAGYLPPP
jgi:hypothetical protein